MCISCKQPQMMKTETCPGPQMMKAVSHPCNFTSKRQQKLISALLCVIYTTHYFGKGGPVEFAEIMKRWGACHEPWFRSWWKGRGKGLRRRGTKSTSDFPPYCIDIWQKIHRAGCFWEFITYYNSGFRAVLHPHRVCWGSGLHTWHTSSVSGLVFLAEVRTFWFRIVVGGYWMGAVTGFVWYQRKPPRLPTTHHIWLLGTFRAQTIQDHIHSSFCPLPLSFRTDSPDR